MTKTKQSLIKADVLSDGLTQSTLITTNNDSLYDNYRFKNLASESNTLNSREENCFNKINGRSVQDWCMLLLLSLSKCYYFDKQQGDKHKFALTCHF